MVVSIAHLEKCHRELLMEFGDSTLAAFSDGDMLLCNDLNVDMVCEL